MSSTALKPPGPKHYRLTWRSITLRITHQRQAFGAEQSLIEIHVLSPKEAKLPITDTGFRAEFLLTSELVAAGGPVAYVTTWLDDEAAIQANRVAATQPAQPSLFDTLPEQRKPVRSSL